MGSNNNMFTVILIALVLIAGSVTYMAMNTPEHRSVGEKLGDAVDKLDSGVDNAARELQDRTPAERIKDDIKDATDNQH